MNLCRTEFIPSFSVSKEAGNGMNSVLQLWYAVLRVINSQPLRTRRPVTTQPAVLQSMANQVLAEISMSDQPTGESNDTNDRVPAVWV